MSVKIEIFDPALCCSTGVCGPSVDPALVQISNAIEQFKKIEVDIQRYNLSQDTSYFVSNETIAFLLKEHGPEILPVTLVNGEVKKQQVYPTTQELEQWTNTKVESNDKKTIKFTVKSNNTSCCDPGNGCC